MDSLPSSSSNTVNPLSSSMANPLKASSTASLSSSKEGSTASRPCLATALSHRSTPHHRALLLDSSSSRSTALLLVHPPRTDSLPRARASTGSLLRDRDSMASLRREDRAAMYNPLSLSRDTADLRLEELLST